MMNRENHELLRLTKWIDILSSEASVTEPALIARVVLENGAIRIEGSGPVAERLRSGIDDYHGERRVLPTEGETFLTAVVERYRTAPYLYASDVKTGPTPRQLPTS